MSDAAERIAPAVPWRARLRRRLGSLAIENALEGLSRLGHLLPEARRWKRGVDVVRDVVYRSGGHPAWRLDLYRPRDVPGPLPVLLYVHGGGFRILSKDTHWMFGYGFARLGWLVCNVDYRLAPAHPFPAALEDACAALGWVATHAADHGGDLARLAYGGESAGANLVTSLAIAGSWRRPEPWARQVWRLGVRPRAVIAACGMLQVSDADRYLRRAELPTWMRDRIAVVCRAYLPDDGGDPDRFALADPLCFLERAPRPERPLPPFFAPVGSRDPILDDTRRLALALERLDVAVEAPVYDGGIHAFHAFIDRPRARRCWADTATFLARLGLGSARPVC